MSDITVNNFKAFYEQIRPYLGAVHSGFTPIGTVISVMGTTAPMNYLACDGTVYNIADYPELAAYFNQQFGSSNFFGGNGTTTFAVPDLRGEFLRGTGTNSHANQGSGANVGVHQDGTGSTINVEESCNLKIENNDSVYRKGSFKYNISGSSDLSSAPYCTFRPTNTSVLYCISSKNIFMDAGSNYSTEEQVVGTWIDGKPIYQKTVDCGALPKNSSKEIDTGLSNVIVVDMRGIAYKSSYGHTLPNPAMGNALEEWYYDYSTNKIVITTHEDRSSYTNVYVTLRYTKTTD